MPVVFRGRSEYDRNFEWNQSYRSASFVPKVEQTANDAGLRSDEMGFFVGPRMSSKKKAWHREPQIQNCLNWWPESDADSRNCDHVEMERNEGSPVIKAHKKVRAKRPSPMKNSFRQRSRSLDHAVKSNAKKSKGTLSPNIVKTPSNVQENLNRSRPLLEKKVKADPDIENMPSKENSPNRTREKKKASSAAATPEKIKQIPSPDKKKLEMESNIPLQRRAGLNVKKPKRVSRARLSEYQRSFAPPQFSMKPSPILTAHDVVHASSPAIPPHSGIRFPKASEYISSYGIESSPAQDSKAKSMSSPASPSMKMKIKNMQKPYTSHGKSPFESEYSAQYEANCKFDVGQLRQIAEENKQKHEGTHIDPEHATQVISPFNKLWDLSSEEGGENMEERKVANEVISPQENKPEDEDQDNDTDEKWSKASQKGSDTIEDIQDDKETLIESDSLEGRSTNSKDSVARKLAWEAPDVGSDGDLQSDSFKESSSVLEGRVSTPRLLEMGGALRTHHDLTTPSVGGVLLVSPSRSKQHRKTRCEVSSAPGDTTQSQIAGSPTYDSHALLHGRLHRLTRSSPEPLRKYANKKQSSTSKEQPNRKAVSKTAQSKSNLQTVATSISRAPIRGALKNEEFQHCGATGKLQTAPACLQQDDDALSLASSLTSARATELLERARGRKSFWTTS